MTRIFTLKLSVILIYIQIHVTKIFVIKKAPSRETLIMMHANNKGTDQPAHRRTLISALAISYLESVFVKLASCKVSLFYVFFVAEEVCLSLICSEISQILLPTGKAHLRVGAI